MGLRKPIFNDGSADSKYRHSGGKVMDFGGIVARKMQRKNGMVSAKTVITRGNRDV